MKKVLIISIIFCICISSSIFASTEFIDVKGTKYEMAVEALAEKGIINGISDGIYKPKDNVTRAQLAKILCETLKLEEVTEETTFSDVIGHWAENYIKTANKNSIIKGYNDGTFKPEANVTYAEAVTMVMRAIGEDVGTNEEGKWYKNYMEKAKEKNMLENITGIQEEEELKRGDTALLIYNMINNININNSNQIVVTDSNFDFNSELVKTITIIDTAKNEGPENYTNAWKYNYIDSINPVQAYIVKNEKNGFYNLYIGGENGIKLTSAADLFRGFENCTKINGFENLDTSNVTDMSCMFLDCKNLIDLDLSNLNTSNVTNMNSMFNCCAKLTKLDLSNFDTSNVINMGGMFSSCKNLIDLDLSSFDTSNVTNISCMFNFCEKLIDIDISSFDTSNVTDMSCMFKNCESLVKLDLTNFNTSNVTDMNGMFFECENLIDLDLSSFDTNKVSNMRSMFYFCYSLPKLDLSNFDTRNVTDMSGMFFRCANLINLNISNFDTSNVTNMHNMFFETNIAKLKIDNEKFDISMLD